MKKIGSIVVSTFFGSGFAVYAFDKIIGNRINWQFSPILQWLNIDLHLRLWHLISFSILVVVLYITLNYLYEKFLKPNLEEIRKVKIEQIMMFNKIEEQNGGLLFKWKVGLVNGIPTAHYIHPYCNGHNPPQKMGENRLLDSYECGICRAQISNHGGNLSEFSRACQSIQSKLEHEWEILLLS
jgi:hypothetical protein